MRTNTRFYTVSKDVHSLQQPCDERPSSLQERCPSQLQKKSTKAPLASSHCDDRVNCLHCRHGLPEGLRFRSETRTTSSPSHTANPLSIHCLLTMLSGDKSRGHNTRKSPDSVLFIIKNYLTLFENTFSTWM